MEITFKAQCPCCKKNLTFMYESEYSSLKPNKEDQFFDIFKNATLQSKEAHPSEDSLAIQMIKNYFLNIEYRFFTVKNLKELEKLKKEMSKKKLVFNKKVEIEFGKQKKRILGIIKNKIDKLKKK